MILNPKDFFLATALTFSYMFFLCLNQQVYAADFSSKTMQESPTASIKSTKKTAFQAIEEAIDMIDLEDKQKQEAQFISAQKNLDEKFREEKQRCFKKFWVERCINQLSTDYYQIYDALNQKIYQYNYEKRVAEFNEKQKILAKKAEEDQKQTQNEAIQVKENQGQHQIKLQFLNPNKILESSPRSDLNVTKLELEVLDTEKILKISNDIRAQIINAPMVKSLPVVNIPPVAQNMEKFQQKQQKTAKREGDLNNRIKMLDDFVKKYKTP